MISAHEASYGDVEALSDLVGSGRTDRRGFLTITGVALTGLVASWVDAPPAMAAALNGDRVTDTMVSTIEQRVSTLRTVDDQLGGARLLEQARGDLALVTGLLGGGRYRVYLQCTGLQPGAARRPRPDAGPRSRGPGRAA
ncbi:hypothetical protein ACWELO_36745, partial [Streptomyces sp. NPDC004596]